LTRRGGAQVRDHPDYARFFKMVAVGVPAQAVRNKMALEGLRAELLDTPDAPFP
jgi:diaphanous 1